MTLLAQNQSQNAIHKFKAEPVGNYLANYAKNGWQRASSPKVFTKCVALTSNKMLKICEAANSTI